MTQSREEKNVSIAIIAIISALALLGVVIVLAVMTIPLQEAEAGCERGRAVNKSLEKSSGRCFDGGEF
ncbi:MAG: hypothetical protein M3264_02635 [Thermoproteota archaeon]|nr:hypothetical protein [Thermoproteota archaeon]